MFSIGGKQWFTILFFLIIAISKSSYGYESMANEAEEYLESLFQSQNTGNSTALEFKQNRGEPGALGNIRLGVDLLIKGPEPAGEYLGGNQETAFNRPSP